MTQIKAIETHYAGCRFRSRLEARWAVFFDHLGIEWRYEPEGFETPAGWYLPDFYLPAVKRWVEIKGGKPTKRDLDRGLHFGESRWQVGEGYRIICGDIPREFATGIPVLTYTQIMIVVASTLTDAEMDELEYPPETRGFLDSVWIPDRKRGTYDGALTAARSARFEHGESPKRP